MGSLRAGSVPSTSLGLSSLGGILDATEVTHPHAPGSLASPFHKAWLMQEADSFLTIIPQLTSLVTSPEQVV